ncbi:MAG: ribonuclease HII, partial [Veillonella sp.]|nr:ribonuclease HII [Veillonella sp.]
TVAAVILPPMTLIPGLNDSKKLTEEKRETLYDIIMKEAVAVSCISYGPEKIDELNIYEATRQAMYEAIRTLSVPAEAVVADAMKLPDLTIPVESIIKGDSKSANIAAASIIAKVTRDRYMKSLDDEYPGYGFGIHKGYYTELHKEAVEQQGVTPLHRKSFEPIKSIVRWVKPE